MIFTLAVLALALGYLMVTAIGIYQWMAISAQWREIEAEWRRIGACRSINSAPISELNQEGKP